MSQQMYLPNCEKMIRLSFGIDECFSGTAQGDGKLRPRYHGLDSLNLGMSKYGTAA